MKKEPKRILEWQLEQDCGRQGVQKIVVLLIREANLVQKNWIFLGT